MIDLYTWTTPNGRKPSILLEELGLPYRAFPVNIGAEEQFAPDFLKISPNNKIPAIIDHDVEGEPLSLFESGAILIYLAEKTGQFLPAEGRARAETLEWLMWQMGGVGPMFGQFYHFRHAAPDGEAYGLQRYLKESLRLLTVLEKRLGEADFLAGEYSIADMAVYPWVRAVLPGLRDAAGEVGVDWPAFKHFPTWLNRLDDRPAVQKGMDVLKG